MAEANQAAVVPASQPQRWPGLLLLIAAIIEFLGGLSALPILAGDLSEVPGPGLGGAIIIATIIIHPIAAGTALFFLVRGNLTWALVAMAVVILVGWITYLPSVQLHGLGIQEADGLYPALKLIQLLILPPILVLAITGLALTAKRLTLATLLAVLPTFLNILSVIAFGISVAIYGF
jgi:hypothetical protein